MCAADKVQLLSRTPECAEVNDKGKIKFNSRNDLVDLTDYKMAGRARLPGLNFQGSIYWAREDVDWENRLG
jgi:hypothetical protein